MNVVMPYEKNQTKLGDVDIGDVFTFDENPSGGLYMLVRMGDIDEHFCLSLSTGVAWPADAGKYVTTHDYEARPWDRR